MKHVLNKNQFPFSNDWNFLILLKNLSRSIEMWNLKYLIFFKLIVWNKVLLQNKTTAVVQLYSIFYKQKGRELMSMS